MVSPVCRSLEITGNDLFYVLTDVFNLLLTLTSMDFSFLFTGSSVAFFFLDIDLLDFSKVIFNFFGILNDSPVSLSLKIIGFWIEFE